MIINDQSGEEIGDPVPEVVRQMLVITHEFNTAVVTPSGRKRQVGIVIRPIKDDQNELLAVYIHIREKTLDQIRMAKKG